MYSFIRKRQVRAQSVSSQATGMTLFCDSISHIMRHADLTQEGWQSLIVECEYALAMLKRLYRHAVLCPTALTLSSRTLVP